MNPNLIIGIAIIAALAAGFACVGAHWIAKRRHWGFMPRYIIGVAAGLAAFAWPLFTTMEMLDALVWLMALCIIFGSEGIFTWLAHDADPEPSQKTSSTTLEGDRLLRAAIDEELRK